MTDFYHFYDSLTEKKSAVNHLQKSSTEPGSIPLSMRCPLCWKGHFNASYMVSSGSGSPISNQAAGARRNAFKQMLLKA